MRILIIGAGVAGLSIGWRLAQAGADVEILERGLAGRGATWASAGMIAPGAELGAETTAMAAFADGARTRWPSFAAELEAASGMFVHYRQSGSLLVAENPARAEALQAAAHGSSSAQRGRGTMRSMVEGAAAHWLTPDELFLREPLLSNDLLGALEIPTDAQVDNRALADALRVAGTRAGAKLRERCTVRTLVIADGRARGVTTEEGTREADLLVLACGAWMNLVAGVNAEALPPVRPVKGQMIACEPLSGTALPQTLIWSDEVYLVPRHKRLFIGATVEEAGFDTSVTREAREWLLNAATRVIPSLASWRVAEMWAGLRPRTPDDAPVLGTTHIDRLLVAGGQFRNGILFAPLVAETVSRLILQNDPRTNGGAFDPKRFAAS
jgi:glycine oxidase